MRLLRLVVADFAAVATADIEFGPGLNVLYGPNDLGKSTLADAIRVGLLLPHTSTHIEPFVPWTGGQPPRIEITFATDAQRIWKVVKVFGKSGSSTLHESRDRINFDETARGRQVDARLREILRWGIPEPGGAGATRSVPTSFLATALLSTQADVGAILDGSLETDAGQSGRDRIAAALQAVAQDPLFVSLLRRAQERRDQAYTDAGAKKAGRDSPLKKAAERVKALRDEQEHWQRVVEESQSVEHLLRDLTLTRGAHEERVRTASDELATLTRLVKEGQAVAAAADQVWQARERVSRSHTIEADIATGEQLLLQLGRERAEAERVVDDGRHRQVQANAAVDQALAAARAVGADPELADTVARQTLELRRASAITAAAEAQQRFEAAAAAQRLVDATVQAESDLQGCHDEVGLAAAAASRAAAVEQSVAERRRHLELLDIALAVRRADERVTAATTVVGRVETLQARMESTRCDCQALQTRRATLVVPPPDTRSGIRRLSGELANARAALDVGLVVTVVPRGSITMRLRKDGESSETTVGAEPVVVEADTRVDLDLADLVAVTVQGGRPNALERVRMLEGRWADEARPHLQAADVATIEALDATAAEVRDLEMAIATKEGELRSLEEQVAALGDAAAVHQKASGDAATCRLAVGAEPLEPLLHALSRLGPDPATVLRGRQETAAREIDDARHWTARCHATQQVAEERLRTAQAVLQAAAQARDAAMGMFPTGVAPVLEQMRVALEVAADEQRAVTVDLVALDAKIATESVRVDTAVAAARTVAVGTERAQAVAERRHQQAIADHASQAGSLEQLRRLRQSENMDAATEALRVASARLATLPAPTHVVDESDVTAAAHALDRAKADLRVIEGQLHKAHGALEQVGGAAARERLQEVSDAYEAAERHEREIEADFEAWKLLLETMKEADAAQASHLGQVLAPAVARRFETLTRRRYESVRLTSHLATQGVVVRGAVRPTERLSVGTREQLSTLYRLSLAEYLGTTVVLDDQLVQSDDTRMDWFRELLAEKAGLFQVVVFTCRPGDYLTPVEMTPPNGPASNLTSGVHAVDLGRAIQHR